jgi:hypothetical protein
MDKEKKEKRIVEEELTAYEKLRQQVSKTFGELNEKINAESISHAMEKAMTDLKETGEHSKDVISKAGDALKKDIVSSISYIKPKVTADIKETREDFNKMHNKGGALWREITTEAEHITEVSLDKGGAFLSNVTKGLGDWARSLSDKLDSSISYKTGEVTHGGTFICKGCEAEIHLKKPGHLPPCPKCSKTEFRRA